MRVSRLEHGPFQPPRLQATRSPISYTGGPSFPWTVFGPQANSPGASVYYFCSGNSEFARLTSARHKRGLRYLPTLSAPVLSGVIPPSRFILPLSAEPSTPSDYLDQTNTGIVSAAARWRSQGLRWSTSRRTRASAAVRDVWWHRARQPLTAVDASSSHSASVRRRWHPSATPATSSRGPGEPHFHSSARVPGLRRLRQPRAAGLPPSAARPGLQSYKHIPFLSLGVGSRARLGREWRAVPALGFLFHARPGFRGCTAGVGRWRWRCAPPSPPASNSPSSTSPRTVSQNDTAWPR